MTDIKSIVTLFSKFYSSVFYHRRLVNIFFALSLLGELIVVHERNTGVKKILMEMRLTLYLKSLMCSDV